MRKPLGLIVTVAALSIVAGVLVAEPQPPAPVPSATLPPGVIQVGQPLAQAERVLRDFGHELREGLFDTTRGDPDITNYLFVLDKSCAEGVVYYSKSKQTVSHIRLIFFPHGNQSKSTRTWVAAHSVTLLKDGSYGVHFEAPKAEEPAPETQPLPRKSKSSG